MVTHCTVAVVAACLAYVIKMFSRSDVSFVVKRQKEGITVKSYKIKDCSRVPTFDSASLSVRANKQRFPFCHDGSRTPLKGQKQDYFTNAHLFMKHFLVAAWFNSSCCVTSEVCDELACSAHIGKRVWGWCVTSQQRFLSRLIISGRYKLCGLRSWTTNMWFTQSAKERVTESNTSSAGKERHVGDPGWHRVQARYD